MAPPVLSVPVLETAELMSVALSKAAEGVRPSAGVFVLKEKNRQRVLLAKSAGHGNG